MLITWLISPGGDHLAEMLRSLGWENSVKITALRSLGLNTSVDITVLRSLGWNHLAEITWLRSLRHRYVSQTQTWISDTDMSLSDTDISLRHRYLSLRHRYLSLRHRYVSLRHRYLSLRLEASAPSGPNFESSAPLHGSMHAWIHGSICILFRARRLKEICGLDIILSVRTLGATCELRDLVRFGTQDFGTCATNIAYGDRAKIRRSILSIHTLSFHFSQGGFRPAPNLFWILCQAYPQAGSAWTNIATAHTYINEIHAHVFHERRSYTLQLRAMCFLKQWWNAQVHTSCSVDM